MYAAPTTTSERRTSVATRPCVDGRVSSVHASGATIALSGPWSTSDRCFGVTPVLGSDHLGQALGLGFGLGFGTAVPSVMQTEGTAPIATRPVADRLANATKAINATKAMAYPPRRPPDTRPQ
jgi:hypothetical protein